MVSFWPWRGDDSSPALFEKTLSALASKIADTQAKIDRARYKSRRYKVLWTLYLVFAYLLYIIMVTLAVGWGNLGPWEWTAVAGGPVAIYVIRTLPVAFYNFQIESLSTKLKNQQAERAKTIQKLKEATKFDSTQQLLEKYGGGEAQPSEGNKAVDGGKGSGGKTPHPGAAQTTPGRTTAPPPPTANIPRGDARSPAPERHSPRPASPGTAPALSPGQFHPSAPHNHGFSHPEIEASAEFAPNAFGPGGVPPFSNIQYAPATQGAPETHWYDRIMDLLMGEDETAPRNRIVLICSRCRLVNGQAPPGTKSLADVGTWKCMGCGATNGEAEEARRIVREVLQGGAQDGGESEGGMLKSARQSKQEMEAKGTAGSEGELANGKGPAPQTGVMKRKTKGKE